MKIYASIFVILTGFTAYTYGQNGAWIINRPYTNGAPMFLQPEQLLTQAELNIPLLDSALLTVDTASEYGIDLLILRAKNYRLAKNHTRAAADLMRAERRLAQRPYPHGKAKLHMVKGKLLAKTGKPEKESAQYLAAFNILKRYPNPLLESICLVKIGRSYAREEDYSRAVAHYREAEKLLSPLHTTLDSAYLFNDMGVGYAQLYRDDPDFDTALYYFEKSISLSNRSGENLADMADMLINVGSLHFYRNEIEEAKTSYLQALHIKEELGISNGRIAVLQNLGSIANLENNLPAAWEYYECAADWAKELGDIQKASALLFHLSNVQEQMQDYEAALRSGRKSRALNDSLMTLRKQDQIIEMRTRFDTERKEQEAKFWADTAELRTRQRNTSYALLTVVFGAGLCIIFLLYRWVRLVRTIALQKAQLYRQETLELLREQELTRADALIAGRERERKRIATDLHDQLGALLSTTKIYVTTGQRRLTQSADRKAAAHIEAAAELIDEAVGEVRRISHGLYRGKGGTDGLRDALAEVAKTLRATGKIEVKTSFSDILPDLDPYTSVELERVGRELINNVVRHARADFLHIGLRYEPESDLPLILEIADDGRGFDLARVRYAEGLGLNSLRNRVAELGGTFELESAPGAGTQVVVRVPVKHLEES